MDHGVLGEYSCQKCLFLPQPRNLLNLISALFFVAFFLHFVEFSSEKRYIKPSFILKWVKSEGNDRKNNLLIMLMKVN